MSHGFSIAPSIWADARFRALWAARWSTPIVELCDARTRDLRTSLLKDQRRQFMWSGRRRRWRANVVERDGERCNACGKPNDHYPGLHLDHVLPLARGGTNDPWNLQLLCADCNSRKGHNLPLPPVDNV